MAIPANTVGGGIFTRPDPEAPLTREQIAQRRRSQAQGAAVLRTAGNALNVVNPNPLQNPLVAADLEDLSQHPLRTMRNFVARTVNPFVPFVPGSNAEKANRMLFAGKVNDLGDRYLGLGAPHLAALRGAEAKPDTSPPVPAALAGDPLVGGYRFGRTLARYGYNPLRAAAATALEHPYATAGLGFASDVFVPFANAPADAVAATARATARGIGNVGRASVNAADRIAATKAAAQNATMASALGNGPLKVTPATVSRKDRLLAALSPAPRAVSAIRGSKPAQTLANVPGGMFDRYHTQVGPTARYATHAAEQTISQNDKVVADLTRLIFGNLTLAEKREVENRAYDTRGTPLPPHIPDRTLDAAYSARMRGAKDMNHGSLDDRARLLREALNRNSQALVDWGVQPEEKLLTNGIFFPKKEFQQRPVYAFREPPKEPEGPVDASAVTSDSLVPLSELRFLGEGGGGGPRGGFAASRRFLGGHKSQPPSYLLADDMLSPQYDPAHQFFHHLTQAQRAVKQAQALKMLEGTGIEVRGAGTTEYGQYLGIHIKNLQDRIAEAKSDVAQGKKPGEDMPALEAELKQAEGVRGGITANASPARLPILYANRDTNGNLTVMGLGVQGRARATNYEDRQRRADALAQAQMEIAPGRLDLRDGRKLKNVSYLAGAGKRGVAGVRDLANAQRRVDTLADSLQGARVPGQWPPNATFDQTAKTPFGDVTRGAPSSILDQFGEAKRRPTPFMDIATGVNRTADRLDQQAEALQESLRTDKRKNVEAEAEADRASRAAALYREGAQQLHDLLSADHEPTKADIVKVAREMHLPDFERYNELNIGKVEPDWRWAENKNSKKYKFHWRPTGEWEEVPPRYIDYSTSPKRPPYNEAQMTKYGTADESAMEAGHESKEAWLDWMKRHPDGPPKIKDYLIAAEQKLRSEKMRSRREGIQQILARFGYEHQEPERVLAALRSGADKLARHALDARTAAVGSAPAAHATAGVAQQAARTLRQAMAKVGSAQEGVVTRVSRTGDAIGKVVERRLVELDDLNDRLAAAKNDRATYLKIKQRQQDILGPLDGTLSGAVDKKWGKLPEGYSREAHLRLGAHDSNAFGIEQNVGKILAEPTNDPRVNQDEAINGFMRGMDTIANMVRFGIVAVPTVHEYGNLGTAHLAEFASRGTPEERLAVMRENAAIHAGQGSAVKDHKLVERLHKAGGLPEQNVTTLGRYKQRQVDVMTSDWSELKPHERADQIMTEKVYRPASNYVFENRERAFAADAFKRYTAMGQSDQEAAYHVRELFGNYKNVTAFERAGAFGVQLQKLLMFYPWLKTAMAFWVKKGILDPNFMVIAPMRAVQTNNTIQGYDDPSKPYTGTAGRNATGEFRRASLPAPQRILEQVGRAALLPYDAIFAQNRMGADARSAASIVTNRLNPVLSVGKLLMDNTAKNVPAYERLHDPKVSGLPAVGQAAARIGQAFIAPLHNIMDAGTDPEGSALTEAGLGAWFTVPGNGLPPKTIENVKRQIERLKAAGNLKEAALLTSRLRQMQGASP